MLLNTKKSIAFAGLALMALTSCKKDDITPGIYENTTASMPVFRSFMPYSSYNDTTAYKAAFVVSGDTVVDLTEGNNRFNMFRALAAYNSSANAASSTVVINETTLKNMFTATNSPFTGSYAYLNSSTDQIRSKTASSLNDAEVVRAKIESFFGKIAESSLSYDKVAVEGQAGKIKNNAGTSSYLVDANGIEWGQVIAKSLIGAYQLDYVCNVLLAEPSLSADNTKVMDGKKISQLEYNWDQALANLTTKPYLYSSLTATSSGEAQLAAYIWEYNKTAYPTIYPALQKGRAAIVNGDKLIMMQQTILIRTETEKAIASAALGYLQKVKNGATDAGVRAHAYGEALGFIFSLRFCKMHGADSAFSDELLNDIEFNTTGLWQLTNADVEVVVSKIKAKFAL